MTRLAVLLGSLALTACTVQVAKPPTPVKSAAPTVAIASAPTASPRAGVTLARQTALVAALADALPIGLVTAGLGSLSVAGSVLSNNGSNVISNNSGSILGKMKRGVLQATQPSPAPGVPLPLLRIRPDAVMYQVPDGIFSGRFTIYDPHTYNQARGADNTAAIVDDFTYLITDVEPLEGGGFKADTQLTTISSKRIPFVKQLVVRQASHTNPDGSQGALQIEYLLGYDVTQADGSKDHVDIHLSASDKDLVLVKNDKGEDVPGSGVPGRMDLAGTNARGRYVGEVRFPPGGNIELHHTHTRTDGGARTVVDLTLGVDGSSNQVAVSEAGQLSLTTRRSPAGATTLEVRDLAGGTPTLLPDAAREQGGIATFDLGNPESARARIY